MHTHIAIVHLCYLLPRAIAHGWLHKVTASGLLRAGRDVGELLHRATQGRPMVVLEGDYGLLCFFGSCVRRHNKWGPDHGRRQCLMALAHFYNIIPHLFTLVWNLHATKLPALCTLATLVALATCISLCYPLRFSGPAQVVNVIICWVCINVIWFVGFCWRRTVKST